MRILIIMASLNLDLLHYLGIPSISGSVCLQIIRHEDTHASEKSFSNLLPISSG